MTGKARPLTANEWKKELRKGAHNAGKVRRNYEQAAAHFLSMSWYL
jgi:hypothetical protein